jgi:hypothetical protein
VLCRHLVKVVDETLFLLYLLGPRRRRSHVLDSFDLLQIRSMGGPGSVRRGCEAFDSSRRSSRRIIPTRSPFSSSGFSPPGEINGHW